MPRPYLKKNSIPERYTVRENADGKMLSCLESPNISVQILRGKVTQGQQARKASERTIFLDGAASGEPFMDPERNVYNMDHHEGCVRSFTMATCEQAAVLVLKGLDLSEKTWMIRANDPDLDTVLAIWVLVNHNRLVGQNQSILKRIMPILRLEGVIDAQGLELQSLTGFPEELRQETIRKIDYLRENELAIKKTGKWDQIDFADYTLDLLGQIDELVYHPSAFRDFKGLEELAREELEDLSSAVVYRTDLGIYEVEETLKRLYKSRPGIVIVEKNSKVYTIRKTDLFIPVNLSDIYYRLNRIDPAVSGEDPQNRWGGSAEIGGSPRNSGTMLTPAEIASACKFAYRKMSLVERLVRITWDLFLGLLVPAMSWILLYFLDFLGPEKNLLRRPFLFLGTISILFALHSYVFYSLESWKMPWFYGIRKPSGRDWVLIFPLLLLSGFLGGFISPVAVILDDFSPGSLLAGWILLPISLEFLFRGLIHGRVSETYVIQIPGNRWFLSRPTLFSAMVYAIAVFIFPMKSVLPIGSVVSFPEMVGPLVHLVGAFLAGISLGMIRERSDSVITSILFHSFFSFTLSIFAWYTIFS